MNGTLPLFQDLEPPGAPGAESAQPAAAPPLPADGAGDRAAGGPPRAAEERHLRAAWRLSRSMWRFRDHSPEQTRAGLAICRHLQALLAASDGNSEAGHR